MTHGPRVHIHSAGQWYRLPAYISAVFEGALRNGKPLASVQLTGRLGMYLVANLEDWRSYERILKGGCFLFPVSVNHVFVASCIDHVDRSSLS